MVYQNFQYISLVVVLKFHHLRRIQALLVVVDHISAEKAENAVFCDYWQKVVNYFVNQQNSLQIGRKSDSFRHLGKKRVFCPFHVYLHMLAQKS